MFRVSFPGVHLVECRVMTGNSVGTYDDDQRREAGVKPGVVSQLWFENWEGRGP